MHGQSFQIASAGLRLTAGSEGLDLDLLEPLDPQHLAKANLHLGLRAVGALSFVARIVPATAGPMAT